LLPELKPKKEPEFCYYSVSHLKGTGEVYGPTLSLAIKTAEALGGRNITPKLSESNTVTFQLYDGSYD